MGSNAARIFVMPATDPINPNVHPLIYRWNGILGQSQAAALEAAGKEGHHLQLDLHELLGRRDGVERLVAQPDRTPHRSRERTRRGADRSAARGAGSCEHAADGRGRRGTRDEGRGGRGAAGGPLPAPTDINPRTEYPRPWMGGRWTLRDIVDYELIATMALLDTVADRREALMRQIYEVNRLTVEAGAKGQSRLRSSFRSRPSTIRTKRCISSRSCRWRASTSTVPARRSNRTAGRMPPGTFVVPMAQVFARYAKDILEKQTYPEVRRSPTSAPEPPYDVSAWSLGMLLGVEHAMAKTPVGATAQASRS